MWMSIDRHSFQKNDPFSPFFIVVILEADE
jgi:hypothetical protein